MKPGLASLFVVGTLAGCSAPPPRSVSYFRANLAEATNINGSCVAGTTRGAECENAESALRIDKDERASKATGDYFASGHK